jgi:hypothetical protein
VEKCKARFVAKGFSQVEGIDYDETFAPVAQYSSVRVILAISAQMGWKVHQMDVKTVFLNGVVEEIYVEQPKGFETFSRDTHVCKLKRALYGLKQALMAWYARIDRLPSRDWALPRVKRIQTSTTLWLRGQLSHSCALCR